MNLRNFTAVFLLLSALFTMVSCGKDDAELEAQIRNNITVGTWRVSNFDDSGDDKTSLFNGYNFTFGKNGTVTASNGAATVSGTWDIVDGDENNDLLDDLDFNLSFGQSTIFGDINDDWDIFAQSTTNLELTEAGGILDSDLLSFRKN